MPPAGNTDAWMHIPDKRRLEVAEAYFRPFMKVFNGCSSVVDLGSGQGYFLEMLRDAGIPATGVELEPDLCRSARQRRLSVINEDVFEFLRNADPEAYDGCLASHIVEHCPPSRVKEMFSLVYELLKPGSPLVVITPNIANIRRAVGDFWRDPSHVRPYPISALSKLLGPGCWDVMESGEHSDRPPSLRRKIVYAVRNVLIGRYWAGDDVYIIVRKRSREACR